MQGTLLFGNQICTSSRWVPFAVTFLVSDVVMLSVSWQKWNHHSRQSWGELWLDVKVPINIPSAGREQPSSPWEQSSGFPSPGLWQALGLNGNVGVVSVFSAWPDLPGLLGRGHKLYELWQWWCLQQLPKHSGCRSVVSFCWIPWNPTSWEAVLGSLPVGSVLGNPQCFGASRRWFALVATLEMT